MKYLHTMVRVTDLDKSLQFFCDIMGMVEVRRMDHEAGRFTLVFLAASEDVEAAKAGGAPTVELTYNWDPEEYTGGRNFGHLAYEVENIYDYCQRLMDRGVTINRPPRDGRMAFIKTPDGISIELLQRGAALEPAEPWTKMENIGTW
ncbi:MULTISPECIES: VOC family protein [unclassified Aminobacter]|uniref:VOC family protein n=1 Tax=unclassified Aminobacter TaxID=2644704 RepID=UPI0004631F2C|nr:MULTISPECIES: VOC family protein [unclassified Aminobacter]TWG53808.1 lactoylglutathione lyase [Aminobacter sp. J44]TWH30235.1 lactoylglutathione lyase [Aminobacter sp. J15]